MTGVLVYIARIYKQPNRDKAQSSEHEFAEPGGIGDRRQRLRHFATKRDHNEDRDDADSHTRRCGGRAEGTGGN